MKDMPEDFWTSVRHVSSFKNIVEYNEYIERQIEIYKLNNKDNGKSNNG